MTNDIKFIRALEVESGKKYLIFVTVDDGYLFDNNAIDTAIKDRFVSLGLDPSNIATIVLQGVQSLIM